MSEIHKKVLNDILGRGSQRQQGNESVSVITEKDKIVRQAISDLYFSLIKANNPEIAINMLAEHVAIMVDMINEFKKTKK